MPTYEYRCKSCGHELEAFQKITEDALRKCPECGKDELERLISGGNFVLKGSGWYKDLYNPNPSKSTRTENDRADRLQKAVDEDKKKSEKKVEAA
jgi:putative FmdB family regulatory protein